VPSASDDRREQAGQAPSPADAPAPEQRPGLRGWLGPSTEGRWIWALEHAQDLVTVVVGVVLVALAVVVLVASIVDFVNGTFGSVSDGVGTLLDRVLLVLILIEVVHTVVITLRARRLLAQPFIVIGLIAVIRKILLVLTPAPGKSIAVGTSQLALLLAMVGVFVASLIAVRYAERDRDLAE
jgi:uncharacterized membrane protein (DUF373 family)